MEIKLHTMVPHKSDDQKLQGMLSRAETDSFRGRMASPVGQLMNTRTQDKPHSGSPNAGVEVDLSTDQILDSLCLNATCSYREELGTSGC